MQKCNRSLQGFSPQKIIRKEIDYEKNLTDNLGCYWAVTAAAWVCKQANPAVQTAWITSAHLRGALAAFPTKSLQRRNTGNYFTADQSGSERETRVTHLEQCFILAPCWWRSASSQVVSGTLGSHIYSSGELCQGRAWLTYSQVEFPFSIGRDSEL